MEEENKGKKLRIWILFGILALILLVPFVYPLTLRLLISLNAFNSIEHYMALVTPFSNKYTLFGVIFMLVLLFVVFVDKFHPIKEFFMGFNLRLKLGDKELGINPNDLIKPSQEVFSQNKDVDINESNEAKTQIKDALKYKNVDKDKNKEEEIKELNTLVDNIRFFSAYNNTNYECSKLLKYLLERKTISKSEFEEKLRSYYNGRIKDVKGKRKKECINRKVDEKIFNYKYLDIIEISDDNEYIILTDLGKRFVKVYLNKEVDEDV